MLLNKPSVARVARDLRSRDAHVASLYWDNCLVLTTQRKHFPNCEARYEFKSYMSLQWRRVSDIVLSKELDFAHYRDVIMGAMACQITSLTLVYSIVYLSAYQRKHQSSASLAFVRGIHLWPVNSPHKSPVTRKMFPVDVVIIFIRFSMLSEHGILIHKMIFSTQKCANTTPNLITVVVVDVVSMHDVMTWKHFPDCWPFWGELTGHWILPTMDQNTESCCFLWC